MTGVLLYEVSQSIAAALRDRVEVRDARAGDEAADVFVAPVAALARGAGVNAAALVAIADGAAEVARASRLERVSAIWEGAPSEDEIAALAGFARGDAAGEGEADVFDELLRRQAHLVDELRVALERESSNVTRAPAPLAEGAPHLTLDEPGELASLARHEERRARAHGRPLALVHFAEPLATVPAPLRPFDVALDVGAGVIALLLPEAEPARVEALVSAGGRASVAWFPSRDGAAIDWLAPRLALTLPRDRSAAT